MNSKDMRDIKYIPFAILGVLAFALTIPLIFPGTRGVNWNTSEATHAIVLLLLWAIFVRPR